MFDNKQPKKIITMEMYNPENNERVEVSMDHDWDVTWPAIADQFHQFLSGMGYGVNQSDLYKEL